MPAPALAWERAGRSGSGAAQEEDASSLEPAVTLGERHRGTGGHAATTSGGQLRASPVAIGSWVAVAGENGAARGIVRARQDAVRRLLRAIGGGCEENGQQENAGVVPLWGPDEVSRWCCHARHGVVRCGRATPPLHAPNICALGVALRARHKLSRLSYLVFMYSCNSVRRLFSCFEVGDTVAVHFYML